MKNKELFIISITIFFTILAWVIIDIYHIQTKINEQINIKPAQIPNYKLDKGIIETLKNRTD
jgi:hypothetical protein